MLPDMPPTIAISIREMAGQFFMPAAFINDSEAEIQKLETLIRQIQPGGLCFFHSRASAATNFEGKKEIPYNADSLGTLKRLIARYQAASKFPLLIAMDAEWGLAMRVENTPQYPYAIALGALGDDDDELLYETGLRMAADCREAGIHWNLAPVADCNTNPNNPVIGYRSFGNQVPAVARKANKVFKGMRDGGILTCAKHFPGHGDTAIDSHLDLPVLQKSLAELENQELFPFKLLIESGIPAVMTAHLAIPQIDPSGTPTSLSKTIIQKLLREKLGFSGLVITDALNMHAVSKRESEAGKIAYMAFEAGNDILCFAEEIPEALELILSKSDELEIRRRFDRIWKLKSEFFKSNRTPKLPSYSAEKLNEKIGYQVLTPIHTYQNSIPKLSSPLAIIGSGSETTAFTNQVKSNLINGVVLDWNWSATDPKSFSLPEQEQVLLALVPPSIKPPNNFGFSEAALEAIQMLLQKRKVWFYHFGNPYALQLLPYANAQETLLAYQPLPAFQQAAAGHFLGQVPAAGHLPIALES
jgi:beta-glucosidase-like glycosyl hydrolase